MIRKLSEAAVAWQDNQPQITRVNMVANKQPPNNSDGRSVDHDLLQEFGNLLIVL